ncbi:MAG: rod shape-determining protein MreD [Scytonematopsis contorta HA4267-MV1]|jgi:rod shape-determining protein MreD|nr:rod shape-determining protein MreD [Scytonematopsis contorta HA4267-MV1]
MKIPALWGSRPKASKFSGRKTKTAPFWQKKSAQGNSTPSKFEQRRKSERRKKPKIKINPLSRWHPRLRQSVDWAVIFGSVMLCLLMLPTRLPGMELLGIVPNWLLIWVVAWSVKRTAFAGAMAGIILGLLQDAMTSPDPTHALSLGIVGFLTGLFQKQRFIQEDFISIAFIVFAMAALSETIFAGQLILMGDRNPADIWMRHQQVALASAIVSSLWAPVVYYPLNRWWQQLKLVEQS